eukprot:429437-Prymnesium_polylepis.1
MGTTWFSMTLVFIPSHAAASPARCCHRASATAPRPRMRPTTSGVVSSSRRPKAPSGGEGVSGSA